MAEGNLLPEEVQLIRFVMSDARGREFVRWIMAKTGLYASSMRMRPNVRPEERVLFNVAQAEFGKRIQANVMEADPLGFQVMNGEAATRKQMEKNPNEKRRDPDEDSRDERTDE